jgi:hypothetical protein
MRCPTSDILGRRRLALVGLGLESFLPPFAAHAACQMIPPACTSARPRLEVADIFRQEAATFLQDQPLPSHQKRVFWDIQACRTAAMGGHVRACGDCDHREIAYNSCRNRHCPKCQALARAHWLEARQAELLPIPYFHIVFTLPASIAAVALQNKRLLYGMLFRAASETLQQVAANPRHLGAAQIGVLAVLHTWGQNLMHHPHLHCVVSGGGLSPDNDRWIASNDYFFLPVKVLSRVFRHKFRRLLDEAFARGELGFYGQLAPLADPQAFRQYVDTATRGEWVVYAKRPFHEPACVLKYLARYTHRVAISNQRLVSYLQGQVTFHYKDYARSGRQRTMTLPAAEFIRRFLMHVLPDGFMRIRHYGLLANRYRQEKLQTCRRLLGCDELAAAKRGDESAASDDIAEAAAIATAISCPVCGSGQVRIVETLLRLPRHYYHPPAPRQLNLPYQDSS